MSEKNPVCHVGGITIYSDNEMIDSLRAENAKLREDITGYRRTVSEQHSDLARLRELLGEMASRGQHALSCEFWTYEYPGNDFPIRKECTCGLKELDSRIQSELKE